MTWLATLIVLLATLISASTAAATPIQAADNNTICINENRAPTDFLRDHNASVMRVIISPERAGQAFDCIRDTYAAGYKIYLSLQYDNSLSANQIADYFEKWASYYQQAAPLWAISVGNEQDVYHGDTTASTYRTTWETVEPVLERIAPQSLHVFGEISPWGATFTKDAWDALPGSPTGVDAIGFHCYSVSGMNGLAAMPAFSQWAAEQHVPLWCSEETDWLDPPDDLARALAASPNVALVCFYHWLRPASPPPYLTPTPLPKVLNTHLSMSTNPAQWVPAPPRPSIIKHPPKRTRSHTATFKITDARTRVTLEYRLDRGRWRHSSNRPVLRRLSHKRHIFYIRARDSHGISQIANYTWTVAK